MNCKQYRVEIEEAGRLAPAGAGLEAHGASCASCRRFGEERASLRGLLAGLGRVDAPPDFEFRLRARMAAADAAGSRSFWQGFRPSAAWLAAAACLVFAAAFVINSRNSGTPGVETAGQPAASAGPVARAEVAPAVEVKTGETVEASPLAAPRTRATAPAAVTAAVTTPPVSKSRGRATAARGVAAREAVASSGTAAARPESSSPSMMGSPVLVTAAIPLPVAADEQPLQVLFKDTGGASRVVKVDPVAFGSNDPAVPGARPANVSFTKATAKQGVW